MTIGDVSGLSIRAKRRDWIVQTASLVLGGVAILPQVGDLIRQVIGDGSTAVFEVQDLGGEGCYRPIDPAMIVLRIHTQQIGREEA